MSKPPNILEASKVYSLIPSQLNFNINNHVSRKAKAQKYHELLTYDPIAQLEKMSQEWEHFNKVTKRNLMKTMIKEEIISDEEETKRIVKELMNDK